MNKINQPEINLSLVPNGIKVRLTKVSELEDAMHPNNIPTDNTLVGYVRPSLLQPIIGIAYGLESVIEENGIEQSPNHWFVTSEVVEIKYNKWDCNTPDKWVGGGFKTLNSIYKIEVL